MKSTDNCTNTENFFPFLSGPCDIIGDVSYEELRASAYDDAKRGTNVQSIVEKERSLLNSKLIEFENLLRNPYKPPSNSNLNTQNTLPGTSTNTFPQTVQNNAPPAVSSFNQLGSSFNTGFQMRQDSFSIIGIYAFSFSNV
ncbi:hypothetical protein HanOQP8_Chr10g0377211 [Helianthus annuus]|nr:hypothetical protein HanLR1_Chr10g0373901 [Helianthus annuus]KAJ0701240.1 hypothetical protein HanOQP8_Chr10g0377211 [Helianthus annuus]